MFLPNSHSFLLVPSAKTRPVIHPVRSSPARVSLETRAKGASETSNGIQSGIQIGIQKWATSRPSSSSPGSGKQIIRDKKKRAFLKAAGIAGASIVASLLLPKKADALILGSSPTTGVVGVKNASNTRINPAREETVSSLLKTSDLTFDAGSLQVKVTSQPAGSSSFSDSAGVPRSGLVNAARNVQVDVLSSALPASASTETTLQTISFGGFKFTVRLATVGSVDYIGEAAIGTATSAAAWRIKRVDSTSGIVIQWAGTGVFNQIWDNRTSLTYS